VALGKILTMHNLWKWHIVVVDRCGVCKRNWEFVDHFLLHCEVACAIWNYYYYFLFYFILFFQLIWAVLCYA
jgi:hypothetical protein